MSLDDTIESVRLRMPAEWWPHAATWLSWPHNLRTWPELLVEAEQAMSAVVAALAPHEHVHINVQNASHRDHVAGLIAAVAPPERITLHPIETDDAWIRDHGAVFVFSSDNERIALDFDYNAWGGKYPPWERDQAVACRMAEVLRASRRCPAMVLEGGSIDVNGAGCLLTTEQCLLNSNRNPDMSRQQIEQRLSEYLGAEEILWLDRGIAGDDTDGHIDEFARFVGETSIAIGVENDPSDINFGILQENRERLASLEIAGQAVSLVDLPMPQPIFAGDQRLPASYANFYIANEVVLLPVFSDPADAEAIAVLQQQFPTRRIVPIDARALIHGLGGIHCLTQQVPAAS